MKNRTVSAQDSEYLFAKNLELLRKLQKPYLSQERIAKKLGVCRTTYINYEKGIYAGGICWVSDAVNYFGSTIDKGYEVVIADYTADPGLPHGAGWYAKPATLYAISRNTEHPQEAAMLLDFLLNDPEMAKLQGVEKGIPLSAAARQTLDEEGMLQGLQYQASLKMEENPNLGKMNSIVENAGLIDAFVEACNLVVFEKETPEIASQELYRKIKKDYM